MQSPVSGDHLRIVAIVQARETAQKFSPLRRIEGWPLLWHLYQNLLRSQLVEQVAIATSTHPRDDSISAFGRENGLVVIRGPEDDVLAGFARAAELLDADVIVRVLPAESIVEPGFVDHLIISLLEQDGDFVLLEGGTQSQCRGVETFTRRALDRLMMDAHDDDLARRHVTDYLRLHPDFVRIARAPAYRLQEPESVISDRPIGSP